MSIMRLRALSDFGGHARELLSISKHFLMVSIRGVFSIFLSYDSDETSSMRVHSVTILSSLLIVLFSFSRVLKDDNIGMFACLF